MVQDKAIFTMADQ